MTEVRPKYNAIQRSMTRTSCSRSRIDPRSLIGLSSRALHGSAGVSNCPQHAIEIPQPTVSVIGVDSQPDDVPTVIGQRNDIDRVNEGRAVLNVAAQLYGHCRPP